MTSRDPRPLRTQPQYKQRLTSKIGFAALALCGLAGPAAAVDIRTIEGQVNGSIKSIKKDDKGKLVLEVGARSIPLSQVRSIEFNPRSKAVPQESATAVLTNGDRLRGQVIDGNEDSIELRTLSLGRRKVSLDVLRALVVNPALDFRKIEKYLRRKSDNDIIFLRTGGEASGVLESMSKDQVVIDMEKAGALPIKLERIDMVLLSEEGTKAKEGPRVRLRLLDGTTLTGLLKGYAEGELELDHPLSDSLKISSDNILELLVLNGAFVYLSDLEPVEDRTLQKFPEGFQYYPEIFGWKKDRSVLGGLIKLGGKTYAKGIGVHSYCSLTYKLDKEYLEFRSQVGLDDSVRFLGEPGVGAVRFRVLLDGKPAKEYPQGILKEKGEAPTRIAVKVAKAKELTIIVDYGPLLHILGRANWADAHLIRDA